MSRPENGGVTPAPWQAMFMHIRAMLLRYRHTCPFPLDYDEVVRSALPTDIFLSKDQQTMPWQNLTRTIRTGRTAYFEIENDTDPKHGPFFLHMDWDIPVPQEEPQVFLISPDNPHLDVIAGWVETAYEIDEQLEHQIQMCRTFLTGARHATFVDKHWPELVPFIGDAARRTPLREGDSPSAATAWQVAIADKVRITDTLAKCALLPDHKCMAWVAFDTDDVEAL